MASYNTVITNEGAALLASVIANQGTLTFSEMRFSTTDYDGVEQTLTVGTFGGVFITAATSGSVVDATTIKVAAQFDNSGIVGDHPLYSIGIVGTDGNTTALIAVCTTTNPDIIRAALTGVSTYAFNINLTVSSTNNITVAGTTAAVLYDVDVVDTLISTATNKPLSANMGRVLGENVEAIVDVYGAKQMLPYPFYDTTKTDNGITFTDNGNGTLTINGTASADAVFILYNAGSDYASRFAGKTILANISGGNAKTYFVGQADNQNFFYTNDEAQAAFPLSYNSYLGVYIFVENGAVITTPITISFMIRDDRITDPTVTPYAKTNLQLTNDKAERADLATLKLTGSTNSTGSTINKDTYFYLNGSYCKAKTSIANGATFTLNTNFEEVTVGGVLSALNEKLANTFGSVVNIISYNSISNMYTCPNDGYIVLIADGAANSYTQAKNSNNDIIATAKTPTANQSFWVTISVRKGMQFYIVNTDVACAARYYPLT